MRSITVGVIVLMTSLAYLPGQAGAGVLNWWDHYLQEFPGAPAPHGEASRVAIRNWRQALNGQSGNGPGGIGGSGVGGGSTVGINTEDLIFVLNAPGPSALHYALPNPMPGMTDAISVTDPFDSAVIQTGLIFGSFFDVFYELEISTPYPYDIKATATGTITGNLSGGPNDWGDFTANMAATYFLDLGVNSGAVSDPWEFLQSHPILWSETINTQRAGIITVGSSTPGASLQGHLDVEAIPEPSTLLLLSTGFVGLLGYGWRKSKQAAGVTH